MATAPLARSRPVRAPAWALGPLRRGGEALLPVAAAVLVGAIALGVTGWDPLSVYRLMLREGFGSLGRLEATLGAATPLLFTGLATAIAFRAGVFNIGVEGSFVLGGLVAAWLGAALTGLAGGLLIPAALLLGAAVGAAWSLPPAVLRARLGVDEVVTTLMLNFVAAGLASYAVNTFLLAPGSANSASKLIAPQAQLPDLGASGTLTIAVLVALGAVAVYALTMRGSARGFELRLTGLNPRFAAASGIPVRGVVVRAMAWSGLVAGLGGAAHALGVVHRFVDGFSPGYGFTGIAIALLARNGAVGVVLASVLFGALASAGSTIQLFSDIPLDIVDVLQGTIMVFAAAQLAGRWRGLRRGAR
jgi:simple sugar transport system permease protein